MGSVIASAAGSAICTACCSVCGRLTPDEDKFGKVSRIPYLFLLILSGVFAVFMAEYGEQHFKVSIFYNGSLCGSNDACDGDGSIYRVSFCLFMFELIHVILVPMVNDFHWYLFPIKFVLFVIGVALTFFLSNDTNIYEIYAEYIARFASILYLLIQVLILIDWAWNIKEWFENKANAFLESLNLEYEDYVERYRCYHNPYLVLNVIVTIVLYFGSVAVVCVFFSDKIYGGCPMNQGFIAVTLILLFGNFIFSAMAGGGTFTVASIMSFYAMFLLYNAISSETDGDCNPFHKSDAGSVWLGILFTLITLCYSSMKADLLGSAVDMSGVSCFGFCPGYALASVQDEDKDGNDKESVFLSRMPNDDAGTKVDDDKGTENDKSSYEEDFGKDGKSGNGKSVKIAVNKQSVASQEDDDEDDDKPKLTKKQKKKNTIYFHLILMLASCYMAMLFSNWGTNNSGVSTSGTITVWSNIGLQWVSILLFWQTLAVFRRENPHSEE